MKGKYLQLLGIVGLVLAGVFGWFVWTWGFCRFYVRPGYIAIITANEGKPLEPGQILAKKGQKGIQETPLGPGRHFLSPYQYKWEIIPLTQVEPGKVAVVTSKIGENLPPGEFLAEAGQKGIWRYPLGPGSYAINPYGYDVSIQDAVSIPIGYISVVTSLSGQPAPEKEFAKKGQKGVTEEILQPGLYYINPKAYKTDLIEIGVNQISLSGEKGGAVLTKNAIVSGNTAMQELQTRTIANQQVTRADYIDKSKDMEKAAPRVSRNWGDSALSDYQQVEVPQNQAGKAPTKSSAKPKDVVESSVVEFTLNQHVEFPSRDGFKILLDMTVEFELLPDKVAAVYRDYGDMPAVVDKILMPQILSASRLKGSAYKATDFIIGEGREKFQLDLTNELHNTLVTKNIEIHDALIRYVNVPDTILDPLQQASVAIEQDQTNLERQTTEKKKAQLNTETQLIVQRSQEVVQETAKLRAEIQAEKEKEVAEIAAEMTRQIAVLERQTAETLAERNVILGRANAEAIRMVDGEKAKGLSLKVNALGNPTAYTLSQFATSLNESLKIRILHAGPGTLWTDGNFSKGEAALLKKGQEEKPPAR